MINEILEFEAYVTAPESDLPRILPKMFTNNFSDSGELFGLEHILTVIARGFLFGDFFEHELYAADGSFSGQAVETVGAVLFRWLGFSCAANYEADSSAMEQWFGKYPQADAWLREYYRKHCNKKNKAKLWDKLEEKWSDSLQGGDYRASQFSIHDVIAGALELGKLREQYMLIKKSKEQRMPDKKSKEQRMPSKKDSDTIKFAKLKDCFSYLYRVADDGTGKATKLQEKTVERLLKNIAAYLYLSPNHPKNQKYVLLNRLQLLCWYGLDDNKNETGSWYFAKCVFGDEPDGKPIMTAISSQRGWRFIKMTIDHDFLSMFDIRLIDAGDIESVNREEYWILKDHGHGVGSLKVC